MKHPDSLIGSLTGDWEQDPRPSLKGLGRRFEQPSPEARSAVTLTSLQQL